MFRRKNPMKDSLKSKNVESCHQPRIAAQSSAAISLTFSPECVDLQLHQPPGRGGGEHGCQATQVSLPLAALAGYPLL